MGYSKQIIKGFSWSFLLNLLAMSISFIKIILLSRFVFGPVEFGIFGVGILVLGILELITEAGVNVFLIQEKDPLVKYLDTAWVISIFRGFLIALLLALFSYPIAYFFKITDHWSFILAFSSIPLLRGFINPAITNLQKNLKFTQDAWYRFVISVIEDVSILALGFLTHNVFSFLGGILIGVVIQIVITFVFVNERPKINFSKEQMIKIINQGKWVTLAQVFDYLFEHTDDVVVGHFLNAFSLGIYQNSYTLSSLPENAIAQQLGKVTFPIYVNIKEDIARIKRAFWRSFWIIFLVTFSFGCLMFLFSDLVVRNFLGTKWLDAIPVLRVLSLFGVVRALTNLFYPVFLAYKKQRFVMITTLFSWAILGVLIVPLTLKFGITGAAASALIGSSAGLPVAYFLFRKLFD